MLYRTTSQVLLLNYKSGIVLTTHHVIAYLAERPTLAVALREGVSEVLQPRQVHRFMQHEEALEMEERTAYILTFHDSLVERLQDRRMS